MSEEDTTSLVPAGASVFNETEAAEFLEYISGKTSKPPACVTRVMTSIANKLTMVAGCDMAASVTREQNLDKFMLAAENRLFNPDTVQDMTAEEVKDLYKEASKRKNVLSESRRKFLAQNRDSLSIQGSEQEKLLTAIMSMSPEQLEKLKTAVADISAEVVESPEETSPETVEGELS